MRTIVILLALAGWSSCARVLSKVNKRGLYHDENLYGAHGILKEHLPHSLPAYRQPVQKYVFHSDVSPVYYDTRLQHPITYNQFGSFLPTLDESTYQFHLPSYTNEASSGYNYPVPTGAKFEEEPFFNNRFNFPGFTSFDTGGVPDSFEILIESALRRPQIPNPKLAPGTQPPPRRILTNNNQHLFYQYPGLIPEPGLRVRVPLSMARPTRIVVPQHGTVAFGSGGLGYSTLPGGRIAIGSGSLGLANVAVVRSNLLPPNPQATAKPPTRGFAPPPAFTIQQRSFDVSKDPPVNDDKSSSSNSYTVFAVSDAEKNSTLLG